MQRKSLWGSYISLSPKTRIWIGVGGMVFATAEKRPATLLEKEELEKISPITVVDHVPK
ncbi:unnamed protein product [Cunninghamella echinulata]